MKGAKKWYCLLIIWLCTQEACLSAEEENPPETGYFSLPVSQQPGPLISLGQSLISPKDTQVYVVPSYIKTSRGHQFNNNTVYVYGVSEDTALQLSLPYDISNVAGRFHSQGLGDLDLQYEHAFYDTSNKRYQETATFVSSLTLPSGSVKKIPVTGYGAPAFLEALTFNRNYVRWSFFVSTGGIITTSNDGYQQGGSYLYQAGIGYVLSSRKKHHIINLMLELTGEWDDKSRIFGTRIPSSGGNLIFLTPSLSYFGKKYFIQFGVTVPVLQQLNGLQDDKYQYNPVVVIGATFD